MEEKTRMLERVGESIYPDLLDQMNLEYYSSFFYKTIAACYELDDLDNVATYFNNSACEEMEHAEKIKKFLIDNDCDVEFYLTNIEDDSLSTQGLLTKTTEEILTSVIDHERFVTDSIQAIYKKAKDLGTEPETEQFLLWFIEEQVEEEDEAQKQLTMFQLANNDYDYNRDILTMTGDEG